MTMANSNNNHADMPECKGCSSSVHVTAEEISKLFGESLRVRDVKLASEEEYGRRIAICQNCEAFQFGTTCRWCGCLMAVKAKLAAARCPAPQGSRW
jgi:hypothetical protein